MSTQVFWMALTAMASWVLAAITWFLAKSQVRASKEELKVRLQTIYEEKFDSATIIAERKKLAEQLQAEAAHEEIQETLMNFFETVGMLLRRGYLDKEMVWVAFSFYAIRWWSACKDYILEERRLQNSDPTIFEEFERLVDRMYEIESEKRHRTRAELEPSRQDLDRFLSAERML